MSDGRAASVGSVRQNKHVAIEQQLPYYRECFYIPHINPASGLDLARTDKSWLKSPYGSEKGIRSR